MEGKHKRRKVERSVDKEENGKRNNEEGRKK